MATSNAAAAAETAVYTLQVARSEQELAALQPEWDALLESTPVRTLCLSWDWLYNWWRVYGKTERTQLRVLVIRAGARLVGLAPFILQRERGPGGLELRVLRFAGTGEPEAEEAASEYLDIVALPPYQEAVAGAVWSWLDGEEPEWDVARFDDLLDASDMWRRIVPRARAGGRMVRTQTRGTRYCVDLPACWDDYLRQLSSGGAKRMLYARRRLAREAHDVQFTAAAPGDTEAALNELVRLHAARWAAKGKAGAFAGARFKAFHERLLASLLPRRQVRLYRLQVDGRTIAALYNLRHGDTEYFYQTGFDLAWAKYSPGFIAIGRAIEQAITDGMRRYDFMKGKDSSYKAAFGCRESPMYAVYLFSPNARGRLLAFAARVKDWVHPAARAPAPAR